MGRGSGDSSVPVEVMGNRRRVKVKPSVGGKKPKATRNKPKSENS